jgi:hypothetical protein
MLKIIKLEIYRTIGDYSRCKLTVSAENILANIFKDCPCDNANCLETR